MFRLEMPRQSLLLIATLLLVALCVSLVGADDAKRTPEEKEKAMARRWGTPGDDWTEGVLWICVCIGGELTLVCGIACGMNGLVDRIWSS